MTPSCFASTQCSLTRKRLHMSRSVSRSLVLFLFFPTIILRHGVCFVLFDSFFSPSLTFHFLKSSLCGKQSSFNLESDSEFSCSLGALRETLNQIKFNLDHPFKRLQIHIKTQTFFFPFQNIMLRMVVILHQIT